MIRTLRLFAVVFFGASIAACTSSNAEPDARDAAPAGDQDSATVDTADAGTIALEFSGLPTNAFSYTQGTYLEGFQFQAKHAIHVTELGYYDSNFAGTAETFSASAVGLYDMTTSTLLGSVNVDGTDTALGLFRYAALPSPIALNTTDTYAVVGVTGSNYYVSGYTYGGEANPAITWVSFAGNGPNNLTETTVLIPPNVFWTTTGNIGPNFIFSDP